MAVACLKTANTHFMDILILFTFFVTLISSILSGIAGGGGAFVTAPYWLMIGMSPAQGANIGALVGVGLNTTSVAAFRNTEHFVTNKRLLGILLAITFVATIIGSFVLPQIDRDSFKVFIAVVTFAALPLLFIDRKWLRLHKHKERHGIAIVAVPLIATCIVPNSAFFLLVSIALSTVFAMTILQAAVVKRFVGMVHSAVMFLLLTLQGHLLIVHGVAALAGSIIGSNIGTKFAIKKGEKFAKWALAITAAVSALLLLFID